jgi:molecular chaperone GrpE
MVKGEKAVSENKKYEETDVKANNTDEVMEQEPNVNGSETLENSEVFEDQEFEGIKGSEVSSLEEEISKLKAHKFKLEDENKKLVNEVETLKERVMRTAAEYENYRRRTIKEKESIYTDACEDVLKNILPILDNLERAHTVNGSVEDIKKGIEMTIRQFNDALSKLQVEEIETVGEFDPNFHNAVMHEENENLGKNTIVEVFQKGYKKGNKVLRYSMVKVAN